ncbi:MAG: GNAT family N-acetyltransferase [Chloroflexi bacterium]|nr:GNAT family N-acetyltransferase [Chloroflexota bacterium]MBP8054986.1 GNAT family N-acetyltransferase [Chloroflexota bacterium]
MLITIAPERPDSPEAIELITELEAVLDPFYPPESRHGFSVEKLVRQGVAFFVTRVDGAAAGCGGIQIVGTEYGELKRMFVRPRFRGLGLGKLMLDQLAAHAQQHSVTILRLETGIHQTEAIGLYESWGFTRIPPFGDYWDDPLSLFFEKRLTR